MQKMRPESKPFRPVNTNQRLRKHQIYIRVLRSAVTDGQLFKGGHLVSVFEGSWANASYAQCDSFVLIPGQNMWSQEARGALYLFALIYTFLGIAIAADVFMNAIEVITSKEIEILSDIVSNYFEIVSNYFALA
eukprot:9040205-Pyramimonas_sp.AAC.2